MMKLKRTMPLLLTVLLCLTVHAQDIRPVRIGCMPHLNAVRGDSLTAHRRQAIRRLPSPPATWDATRVYKQLVVLVSYSDLDFSRDDPRTFYSRILNEKGFNEGLGPGCAAEYLREQSAGLFNVEFDVLGPYKVSAKAQPFTNPHASSLNWGEKSMEEAALLMADANPDHDFRQYDWDGDGYIEQAIFIFAGYAGNQSAKKTYGYLRPNTGYSPSPNKTKMTQYSASAELWSDDTSCGIGTICHEYMHTLGLPDIYPLANGYFSMCDEWDLMDGGNFTNRGWCPPCLTAPERMYLGWLKPKELTEPTTISGMKPLAQGGEAYIIRHTDNEYLLLENRQQTGWDQYVPGKGLLVYHIDFDHDAWKYNQVNVTAGHFRYDIVHADNLDYEQWDRLLKKNNWDIRLDMVNLLCKRHLSTSPYPWATDSTTFVNDELSDSSVPATVMFNQNDKGETLLSKAISNIRMDADGSISFDFMGGEQTAIRGTEATATDGQRTADRWYTLDGRRLSGKPTARGIYIRNARKEVIR